ncbi:MAG TPA: pyridoxal 5'-phosphate synthase glutaminase subunit PdxT [Caldilineaceae bacterium]|nr:pyridoxal 5'-phosphate synthase glutaminase subunit PdxT [Caldilineaceae bacterium]
MSTNGATSQPVIGVLALQGAFQEHVAMLRRLGAPAVEVRKPEQLAGLAGLILPGGESTTMGLVAERWGLVAPLRAWVRAGRPIWGTCAGMILLAERATGQKQGGQPLLGGLDVTVNRNYFGRQVNSFETVLEVSCFAPPQSPAVFIRAPAITEIGPEVEPLAALPGPVYVAVRQGNILATAFHPELTPDTRWHALFLEMVNQASAAGGESPEAISAGGSQPGAVPS